MSIYAAQADKISPRIVIFLGTIGFISSMVEMIIELLQGSRLSDSRQADYPIHERGSRPELVPASGVRASIRQSANDRARQNRVTNRTINALWKDVNESPDVI